MADYSNSLIEKYAGPVPRYTSYPTAPHFHEGVGSAEYHSWLNNMPSDTPVSLYIHIPYCDRLCWFCGCHTKQTLKYEPIQRYLEAVYHEIKTLGNVLDGRAKITHLHLGGGSPSMLRPPELRKLKSELLAQFKFSTDAEISLELDPSDIGAELLSGLREFGMTRASIGVQDFDPAVQEAINRPQSFEDTKYVVDELRKLGVNSLNIDALYGLPLQSEKSMLKTLEQVVSLNPDRIAMFGYAHVPWMKKHQKLIPQDTLPDIFERFTQARSAEKFLGGHDYQSIGIDHFAKADDSMAVAARHKRLARNFQGYTPDNTEFLLGLGASSIGQTPRGYVQNTIDTGNYMRQVVAGELPIARGFQVSQSDKMHRAVIEQIMCYFEINKNWLDQKFGVEAGAIHDLARELVASNEDGYFLENDGRYFIPPKGQPFARQIAGHFDAYLNLGKARHSVAV